LIKNNYIGGVDIGRGMAIMLVFVYHSMLCIFPHFELKKYSSFGFLIVPDLRSLVLNFSPVGLGWIGVQLFLVISGFLIHYIHLQLGKDYNWWSFFKKRFWRIYPPYIIALLIIFIYTYKNNASNCSDFWYHTFLVHNLTESHYFSVNPSFWSIALEAQLYLLYPIVIFCLRWISFRNFFILSIFLYVCLTFIGIFFQIKSYSFNGSIFKFWFVWLSGAWLAECFIKNKRLVKNTGVSLCFFYVLLIIFRYNYYTNFFILIPATLIAITVLEWLIRVDLKFTSKKIQSLFKCCSYIGLISYSLYLFHQPFLGDLLMLIDEKLGFSGIFKLVGLFFTFLILLSISYINYIIVERGSIKMGQKFLGKS
jgi:peptidoglycan/LPS O-acetylase OafA/YrhL